ncbi:TPA: hypothetical protein ACGOZY_001634 [Streptococcus suis]
MKIERNFGEGFPYSMHDARITKIEHLDNQLILHMDSLFYYTDNQTEQTHKATILFEQVDKEDVEFFVFEDTVTGDFSGTCIGLKEYQKKYQDSEFEVIVETYNWSRAVFQGWLWTGATPVTCLMNIFYSGKMLYQIGE